MKAFTKISEVCKNFGLTTRTLRYYEEIGLIESRRSEEYAYRMYDEKNLRRIQEIIVLRKLDVSIKNIMLIYKEENQEHLKKVIRLKLDEMNAQAETVAELKKIVALFLKEIEENHSILTGMALAEKSAGQEKESQSEYFDFTRFVELCGRVERKHSFSVIPMKKFNFNFSFAEVEAFEKRQDCYYVFDADRNCFGQAVIAAKSEEPEQLYAVTVAEGESDIHTALFAFGDWLKSSAYIRAEGQQFCLLKNIGVIETDDGPLEQLALLFPVTPLNTMGNPADEKLQLNTIKKNLTEGFKMFNSTLETTEMRSFSSAEPVKELGLFALPALRVIGKKMELPLNFKENPIPAMWDNMFQNGDFQQLEQLTRYRNDMYVGLSDCKNAEGGNFVYYAGVLCPAGTKAPVGFESVDLNSTLAVLGRFGEGVKKVQRGVKKMGFEIGYGQGAGTAWDMEIYFKAECNGPAAGKNYGAHTWRMLIPVCKKVNRN